MCEKLLNPFAPLQPDAHGLINIVPHKHFSTKL